MGRKKVEESGGVAVAEPPMIDAELRVVDAAAAAAPKQLAAGELRTVVLAEVIDSPYQPRKSYDDGYVAELAESIRANGIQQPPVVRPQGDGDGWELVVGHCRVRAARLLGLEHVEVIVRDMSSAEVQTAQLVENLQRRDLSAIDEAEALQRLVAQTNVPEVARDLGLSVSQVYTRLKLLDLVPEARAKVTSGEMSASIAVLLARVPASLQVEALGEIFASWRDEPATVREVEEMLAHRYLRRLDEARWALDDAALVPAVGPCSTCPHRSDAGLGDPDGTPKRQGAARGARLCLEPSCYARKLAAHTAHMLEEARAGGRTVVQGKKAEQILREIHMGGGAYVDAAHKPYEPGRAARPWATVMAKAATAGADVPEPLVVVDDEGAVHEVYPKKAAEAAARKLESAQAKAGGGKGPSAELKRAEEQRRRDAEEREERARDATISALCARASKLSPTPAHWRFLVEALAQGLGLHFGRTSKEDPIALKDGRLTRDLKPQEAFGACVWMAIKAVDQYVGDLEETGELVDRACKVFGVTPAPTDTGDGPASSKRKSKPAPAKKATKRK